MFRRLIAWKNELVCKHRRRAEKQRQAALRGNPLSLEALESRAYLATFPVAFPDGYSTPLNTDLVISSSANNRLILNDFDAEFSSLTSSNLTTPSNGTITASSSDGSFTYQPNTGFQGLDSFSYTLSNGTHTSSGTVSIAVGGTFGPRTNQDANTIADPLHSGANILSQGLSLGQSLVYNSQTVSLTPIIVVETTLVGTVVPNSIDAVLTLNGVGQGTVSYTNTGLATGDSLRFALEADASGMSTGMYSWSMEITANFTGSSTTRTYTGSTAVVNRASSEWGKGWWLQGVDELVVSGAGALLVRASGETLWFKDNGSGYDPAPGDLEFQTLVENGNGTFTLTTKNGIARNFSAGGLLTSLVDRNSNTIAYAYNGSDQISTITDAYSRVHSFSYSSGRVSTFTDYASRATGLAYTSGQLTTVTLTDPDAGGSKASPLWEYAYSGTPALLTTQENPLNYDTVPLTKTLAALAA